MKKIFTLLTSAALALGTAASIPQSFAHEDVTSVQEIANAVSAQLVQFSNSPVPFDLINWKVGDQLSYNISLGGFAKLGTMVKSVTKDEGTALWFRQKIVMMSNNEVVDALINKADGKILKMLRNGQEQQIPDDQIEIISQEYTQVTVPKGTFQALHVVAKSQQVSKIEVWVNPRDTSMEGTLKQIMSSQFGDITMALTDFVKIP